MTTEMKATSQYQKKIGNTVLDCQYPGNASSTSIAFSLSQSLGMGIPPEVNLYG
jgi:hypothetical protein